MRIERSILSKSPVVSPVQEMIKAKTQTEMLDTKHDTALEKTRIHIDKMF